MTAPRIEPGVLCIVIRSVAGNEGAVVQVVRWQPVTDWLHESRSSGWNFDGWLCIAARPLKFPPLGELLAMKHPHMDRRYGAFRPEQLLPITPPPGTDTEHTDTPADAVPA
jgi:hypothetical protein